MSFSSDLQQISPLSELDHESGFRESESPPSPSPIMSMDHGFLDVPVMSQNQMKNNRHMYHGQPPGYVLNPVISNQSPSPSSGLLIHYLNHNVSDQFQFPDNCSKDMISASSSTSSNIGSSSCTGSSVNGSNCPNNILIQSLNSTTMSQFNPCLPFVSESSPILGTNGSANNDRQMKKVYFNDYSTVTNGATTTVSYYNFIRHLIVTMSISRTIRRKVLNYPRQFERDHTTSCTRI